MIMSKSIKKSALSRPGYGGAQTTLNYNANQILSGFKSVRKTNKNSYTRTTVCWLPEGTGFGGEVVKGKEGQTYGDRRRFDFGS